MEKLTTRWVHLRQVFHRGVWMILLGVWGLFGLLATIRDNFVVFEDREKWDTLQVIPYWSLETWLLALLAIVLVGLFEGSYRIRREQEHAQQELSTQLSDYRILDPRIDVSGVEAHDFNPYLVNVEARVENPGDPTVLKLWSLEVTRCDGGEPLAGQLTYGDHMACRSVTKDHARTPLGTGEIGEVSLHYEFKEPIVALNLDDRTRFTVSCCTIKNVRVQGSIVTAPVIKSHKWLLEIDPPANIDRQLGLLPDSARTSQDRLIAARDLFDRLGQNPPLKVRSSTTGDGELKHHTIGYLLLRLSLECYGMTTDYVRDYDHVRGERDKRQRRDDY